MTNLTKSKLVAYLAVIFVAGAITGGAVGLSVGRAKAHEPRPKQADSMKKVCDHMKKKLTERLGPTEEQQAKIFPIVDESRRKMDAIHREAMEKIERVVRESDREMAVYLNEDQKRELEEMDRERQEFMARFRRGPGERRSNDPVRIPLQERR